MRLLVNDKLYAYLEANLPGFAERRSSSSLPHFVEKSILKRNRKKEKQ